MPFKAYTDVIASTWKKITISKTVHVTTKSFVTFCSAQDGESAEINYSVFEHIAKMAKIQWNVKIE